MTDAALGVSLLAGVALVMGLTLPLLSPGGSSDPTAALPARDHTGAAATNPPDNRDPNPVSDPPANQPVAPTGVEPSSTPNPVTLLADGSGPRPADPVTTQPGPPEPLGSPISPGPITVGDPGHQLNLPAVSDNPRSIGDQQDSSGVPDSSQQQYQYQLDRLAKELAKLQQQHNGGTNSGSGVPTGTPGGGTPNGGPNRPGNGNTGFGSFGGGNSGRVSNPFSGGIHPSQTATTRGQLQSTSRSGGGSLSSRGSTSLSTRGTGK